MFISLCFLVTVGAVVTILAGVGLCIFAVDQFFEWRHAPHQRSYRQGEAAAYNHLANDSWWFSESQETMELLANLARGMSVSDAREKWRKARANVGSEVRA